MSIIADDYGFAIKQKYVNELIQAAVDKSANKLREFVNDLSSKALKGGEMGPDIQKIKENLWEKVALEVENVRRT